MSLITAVRQRTENLYKERQQEDADRLALRRQSYLEAHPELFRLFQALKEARFERLNAVIEGAAAGGGAAQKKIEEAAEEKLAAAEKDWQEALGKAEAQGEAPPEERYFCPQCKDQGRLGGKVCPACYPESIRYVLQESGISYLPDPEASFDNFRLDIFSDETIRLPGGRSSARLQAESNLKLMQDFAADFPENKKNYYFYGKTGTGKTYTASCVVNALLDRGYMALIVGMMQFEEQTAKLRTLQNTYGVNAERLARAEEKYDLLVEADFLVLDEFGLRAGLLPNPEAELMMLFRERIIRSKPTLLTSNLMPKDLASHYNERVLSRLMEYFEMRLFLGEDLRLKGKRRKG
mgnify:CR=1 FL=1